MALRAPHFFLSNVTYQREESGPAGLGSRSCSSGCEVEGAVGAFPLQPVRDKHLAKGKFVTRVPGGGA